MMDLHVSVVLLLLFLTGGHSLKCYMCISAQGSSCVAKVQMCGDGVSKCVSETTVQSIGFTEVSVTTKQCAATCEAGTQTIWTGGTVTTRCCHTDLCNGADGVFKGSFLLLLSPLLVYFLFQ